MSELKDRLQADMVAAMKAHDELTKSTLRMAIAAIKNEQVAGGRRPRARRRGGGRSTEPGGRQAQGLR